MKKQYYIPRRAGEKIRVAIMFQVASYWASIESFYRECVAADDISVRIYYVDDLAVEKVQMEGTTTFLEENYLPYEVYSEEKLEQFHPHVALYQPPYDVLYRNPPALSVHLKVKGIRIMYIPYGIELADTEDARLAHFHTYVVRNSWRIYTFSETMLEDYRKYCPNRHAVRATGSPKFDGIYKNRLQMDEGIKRKAAGRRIVVWKIHFPKRIYDGIRQLQVTPDLSEYISFAKMLAGFEDLFFVVMPHPLFFSETLPQILAQEAGQLFRYLEAVPNVVMDLSPDYRCSLYHADAIIADRSALMVEAGLCGVPVLYMENRDYREPLTAAVRCIADTYVHGVTAADMAAFLEKFRKGALQDCVDRQRAAVRESVPFLDGLCGRRILEDVRQGIQEEGDYRIRVVFFGAGSVCAHYIKELGICNHAGYEMLGISDNDPDKWGETYAGMRIIPPERLKALDFDYLVITTEQYHMPIKQKLVYELFLDEEKILRLDVFSEMYVRGECSDYQKL